MRKFNRFIMAKTGISVMTVFALLAIIISSCSGRENKGNADNAKYVYGNWQVVANTNDFENSDSLLFIINPAKAENDSAFYNGIYTSSYVMNDSVRATIIYDTIAGYRVHFHRMVAVTVNPSFLNVEARKDSDSITYSLNFSQLVPQYNVYKIEQRDLMDSLMSSGKAVYFSGITPGGATNSSAQTYSFTIYTKGFNEAQAKCREYNINRPAALRVKTGPTISETLLGL